MFTWFFCLQSINLETNTVSEFVVSEISNVPQGPSPLFTFSFKEYSLLDNSFRNYQMLHWLLYPFLFTNLQNQYRFHADSVFLFVTSETVDHPAGTIIRSPSLTLKVNNASMRVKCFSVPLENVTCPTSSLVCFSINSLSQMSNSFFYSFRFTNSLNQ